MKPIFLHLYFSLLHHGNILLSTFVSYVPYISSSSQAICFTVRISFLSQTSIMLLRSSKSRGFFDKFMVSTLLDLCTLCYGSRISSIKVFEQRFNLLTCQAFRDNKSAIIKHGNVIVLVFCQNVQLILSIYHCRVSMENAVCYVRPRQSHKPTDEIWSFVTS